MRIEWSNAAGLRKAFWGQALQVPRQANSSVAWQMVFVTYELMIKTEGLVNTCSVQPLCVTKLPGLAIFEEGRKEDLLIPGSQQG